MTIKINSRETLECAADFYHDIEFYTNRISFNKAERVFSLKLNRIKWEKTIIHLDLFFIKVCSAPKTESVLYFEQVNDIKLHLIKTQLSEGQPVDCINTIEYYPKEHNIEFKCINGSNIKLFVERLSGKLEDIGKTTGKTHFIYFFGIEFGGR